MKQLLDRWHTIENELSYDFSKAVDLYAMECKGIAIEFLRWCIDNEHISGNYDGIAGLSSKLDTYESLFNKFINEYYENNK